jgi:hypothetical protein
MGRNTNTPDPASLDRYSVGEITQLVGQSVFYNAGTSKWLKTGSFTLGSNLTSATKTGLAAGSTDAAINTALLSANEDAVQTSIAYCPLPAQRISASSVTVYPGFAYALYTCNILSVTSSGAQPVNVGLTSVAQNTNSAGGNLVVASNNTTIFAYTNTSSSAIGAVSTTDGSTWSSVTLTGLPVFSDISTCRAYGTSSTSLVTSRGRNTQTNSVGYGVFWCGARFILIINDVGSTYLKTSTSTNGIAWSGDTTVTVLGSATISQTGFTFYRNGNSCILGGFSSAIYRYTTDGGVTWAACPTISYTYDSTVFQKTNTTTPAKLFYTKESTTSFFTADTGATWTSRTLPVTATSSSSFAYMGSTLLMAKTSFGVYRSVNDGATFTAVLFPVGTLATEGAVYADAYRFYFVPNSQNQILTSSDGITWTITTVSAGGQTKNGNNGGIIAYSSSSVGITGYSSATGNEVMYLTTDGGVTWIPTTTTSLGGNAQYSNAGDAFISPDGLGGGTAVFGGTYGNYNGVVCSKQTFDAGGAYYRSGATAVTPTNTNALVYVRVE